MWSDPPEDDARKRHGNGSLSVRWCGCISSIPHRLPAPHPPPLPLFSSQTKQTGDSSCAAALSEQPLRHKARCSNRGQPRWGLRVPDCVSSHWDGQKAPPSCRDKPDCDVRLHLDDCKWQRPCFGPLTPAARSRSSLSLPVFNYWSLCRTACGTSVPCFQNIWFVPGASARRRRGWEKKKKKKLLLNTGVARCRGSERSGAVRDSLSQDEAKLDAFQVSERRAVCGCDLEGMWKKNKTEQQRKKQNKKKKRNYKPPMKSVWMLATAML